MKKKILIISTLGPSSLNSKFLKFANNNIDLLRLNMSHINLNQLEKKIKYIRKFTKKPICIDTEGAQIRTKVKKEKYFKKKSIIKVYHKFNQGNFSLYPEDVSKKLKIGDLINIGFQNLKVRVIKTSSQNITTKVISSGKLEKNKGVHIENRKIKLNFLTPKDKKAIAISLKNNINNFALSFTNSADDIKKFNSLLINKNKIFKIETKNAVKKFRSLIKMGNNFLLDRGDMSKEVKIENIPKVQRELFKIKNKNRGKKLFVATNLLESMIVNDFPNRGEANDIYNSLEMGSEGLVLAAETAVGKFPINSVNFLKKMIYSFQSK
tara:strand:- start:43 stop:1011 length:969 start_codon:yes stop_codon:yes gene_type:complete